MVNVSGNNWLKHGELLNLTVHCNGTGPWEYCVAVYSGRYNVTGRCTALNGGVRYTSTHPTYLNDNIVERLKKTRMAQDLGRGLFLQSALTITYTCGYHVIGGFILSQVGS